MPEYTNDEMIARAAAVLNPRPIGDDLMGDVGCALLTDQGNIYLGVCIDVGSGIGFCAEHSAIAAMVTAGEYRIKKIVAVWKGENGLYVLSPCGRCRQFMRQIHPDNMQAEVILGRDTAATLAELLPYADWFQKV